MDRISYGIVERYDPTTGCVDIRLDDNNDDRMLLSVPVSGVAPTASFAPPIGSRCIVGHTSGGDDAVCLGYSGTQGEQSDAERETQDVVQGDVRFGTRDGGLLELQSNGLTVLQAAPGTGIMLEPMNRVCNIVGSEIAISTPVLNASVGSDDMGQPSIGLFLYNALGKILECLVDFTSIFQLNAPGLRGIVANLGGNPTNPAAFCQLNIVGAEPGIETHVQITPVGASVTTTGSVQIQSASSITISAPSISLSGAISVSGALNVNGTLSVYGVPLQVP